MRLQTWQRCFRTIVSDRRGMLVPKRTTFPFLLYSFCAFISGLNLWQIKGQTVGSFHRWDLMFLENDTVYWTAAGPSVALKLCNMLWSRPQCQNQHSQNFASLIRTYDTLHPGIDINDSATKIIFNIFGCKSQILRMNGVNRSFGIKKRKKNPSLASDVKLWCPWLRLLLPSSRRKVHKRVGDKGRTMEDRRKRRGWATYVGDCFRTVETRNRPLAISACLKTNRKDKVEWINHVIMAL